MPVSGGGALLNTTRPPTLLLSVGGGGKQRDNANMIQLGKNRVAFPPWVHIRPIAFNQYITNSPSCFTYFWVITSFFFCFLIKRLLRSLVSVSNPDFNLQSWLVHRRTDILTSSLFMPLMYFCLHSVHILWYQVSKFLTGTRQGIIPTTIYSIKIIITGTIIYYSQFRLFCKFCPVLMNFLITPFCPILMDSWFTVGQEQGIYNLFLFYILVLYCVTILYLHLCLFP